MTSAETT